MLHQWLSRYQKALLSHPFRTNVASGALVMFLGDTFAQTIERREKGTRTTEPDDAGATSYDLSRAAVMVSWSALGDVPINLMLFSAINKAMRPLGIPAVASFSQSLLKGVCFFVPGVVIRMPCFIAYVTSCEFAVRNAKRGVPLRSDWEQCVSRIRDKMNSNLLTIFDRGAKLWIPVNTLTFYAVPVHYRPLALSCATVGWMTYLSLMQHED